MQFLRKHRGWLRLLGVLLLVALVPLFKIDLAQTARIVARADVLDVTLAVALFLPFLASKAWRWQVILRDLRISISFGEAMKLYALGLGAGMVTPGQVGDAVKAAYFRERGLARALVSIVLDRLWDILILLLLTGSGALLFWRQLQSEWLALAALLVGTLAVLGITASPRAQAWLLALLQRLRGSSADRVSYEPIRLSPAQILYQFTLTVLATGVVYLRCYLLTVAVGVHLALIPFVATMSLATVAALLPVSVSGLGTRDIALQMVAPIIGITPEQALGVSVLLLFLNVVNGLVGLAVWLFWKPDGAGRQAEKVKASTISRQW